MTQHIIKENLRQLTVTTRLLKERYYQPSLTLKGCRYCNCYNLQWSCPPLDDSMVDAVFIYEYVTIYALVISIPSGTPQSASEKILAPLRQQLEAMLLEEEQSKQGRSAGTIGKCSHCGERKCARVSNDPCRHPELVRPSLEALGFNVVGIMKEELGITLQWGSGGLLPEQLLLVGAVFHPQISDRSVNL